MQARGFPPNFDYRLETLCESPSQVILPGKVAQFQAVSGRMPGLRRGGGSGVPVEIPWLPSDPNDRPDARRLKAEILA